jgi:hypothetical protein
MGGSYQHDKGEEDFEDGFPIVNQPLGEDFEPRANVINEITGHLGRVFNLGDETADKLGVE